MDWIFQAVPKRYDLRSKFVEGHIETWLVSRYRDEMKKGDRVFFWLAGDIQHRGLYGYGKIISNQAEYFPNWGYGMKVEYERRFDPIIPSTSVTDLTSMKKHPLVTMPIGTNFRLSQAQSAEIELLIP